MSATLFIGPTYAAEAGAGASVERIPGDRAECARLLAKYPELADREHGCWIEITTAKEQAQAAFGVATAAAYHGGAYINGSTYVTMAGIFNVWSVTASFGYRYNGYHVYKRWVDCSNFFGWGYEVIVTWCGQGLAQSYPYTDYGANFTLKSGPFTWGKGMREQVWANGNVCCRSSW